MQGILPGLVAIIIAVVLVGCRAPALQLKHIPVVTESVQSPGFQSGMAAAVGVPFVASNQIVPLVNGDAFVPAMVRALQNATNSIHIETFIWKSGQMSDQILAPLLDRARAGVQVRIIADGMGTFRLTKRDRQRLREAGVRFIEINNPSLATLHRINFRDHRKLIIVDGRVAFTGGFCIGDKWLGNAERPDQWRETVVQVEGPVVRQFQSAFAINWLEGTGELLTSGALYPPSSPSGDALAQCFVSGPGENAAAAHATYLMAIATARKRILLEQSYFVPDDLSLRALREARERGVEVVVITPGNINFNIVRRASRTLWPELLKAGVKIYEYGPAKLHCKILIVDDAFVTIGSVNFDERSFRINDEANVNVVDPGFGAEMVAQFERDLSQSRRITMEDHKNTSWHLQVFEFVTALFRSQL